MGYRVFYLFNNGVFEDVLDEVFESKGLAAIAAAEGAENYRIGCEVLKEAGEDPGDEEIIDWRIVKN